MSADSLPRRLAARAAERYRAAGRFAYYFARGKLGGDPVFTALLARGLIPEGARLLDLGCGQGLLAAWLDAARASHQAGNWPDTWPAPPRLRAFRGIELMPRDVERARRALGALARIECADIRSAEYGAADVVTILDVLHYMNPTSQEQVLRRVRAAIGTQRRAVAARRQCSGRIAIPCQSLGRRRSAARPRSSAGAALLPLTTSLVGQH